MPQWAIPLNYQTAIRKRVSRAVARLCILPLILFFVGYNVWGEMVCPSCYLSVNTEYIQCMAISGFQGCPLTREHKCGNIMRILQSYKAKLPYCRNTKALQFVKYKSSALYVRGAIREIYESHISCHTKQYIVWQEWNTKAIRCMTEKYLVEKVYGISIDTIFGWFTF